MSQKNQINGWLNLHKPLGVTSAKAVAIVKRSLRPTKIGHAGTLDPLASGVLPLALGEATKTMQFCMDTTKEYEFTVKWGEATDTGDVEGKIIQTSDVRPTDKQIFDILPQFIGDISQTPPAYSAIKINGKRAYELARQGEVVEMKVRQVMIYDLEYLESSAEATNKQEGKFRVSCGKGTYIRSLAQDIAAALGTCGHVTRLMRTKVGNFSIKDAILLENVEKTVYKNAASEGLMPVDTVLDDIQVLEFTSEEASRLKNGQKLGLDALAFGNSAELKSFGKKYIAKCEKQLVAICSCDDGVIKPIRVFNL